jgi:hypothetical protein
MNIGGMIHRGALFANVEAARRRVGRAIRQKYEFFAKLRENITLDDKGGLANESFRNIIADRVLLSNVYS